MEQGEPGPGDGTRGDGWTVDGGDDGDAEPGRDLCQDLAVGAGDDPGAGREIPRQGVKGRRRGFDLDVGVVFAEGVAQRQHRVRAVVGHQEDRPRAADARRRTHRLGDGIHRRREDLALDDAQRFDIEQFAEAPAGVVVRMGLGIVRAPVLAVEERVGDPAVRLVHAHDEAACRREAHGRRCALAAEGEGGAAFADLAEWKLGKPLIRRRRRQGTARATL